MDIINKINGTEEEFSLEHRVFNMMAFFSIMLSFQSAVFNYTLKLDTIAVISPFICGVVMMFNYYLSRKQKFYTIPIISAFSVFIYIFIPIIWIYNGGIDGGTPYYIFILSVMIGIISLRKDVKFFFGVSLFTVVGILIYINVTNPEIIGNYNTYMDRMSDLSWGIFVTMFGLMLITNVFLRSYTSEREKNVSNLKLISEQKKEIQFKNMMLERLNSSLNEKIVYTEDLYNTLLEEKTALEEIALYDDLTGFYNRREIIRIMTEKVQDYHIYGSKFVTAILDIDHFKQINDRYGISTGDELLSEMSFLIKNRFGGTAFIGRYSGEEFLLIIENDDVDEVYKELDSFRIAIKEKEFTHYRISLTISGYMELYEGKRFKAYLDELDRNLFKSKSLGNDIIIR